MLRRIMFVIFLLAVPAIGFTQFSLEEALPAHNTLIRHQAYTLKYNEQHEQAEWVAYILTKDRAQGTEKRTNNYRADPAVTTGSAALSDYKGSGFDRGHLAPAADMAFSKTAMSESFFMSNMSPQRPGFNRGVWKRLESLVRNWAVENEELYIVTGPVLTNGVPTIGSNQVSIPNQYFKVILDNKEPEIKAIGFVLAHQSSSEPLQTFAVSVDLVESMTGLDFFPVLVDSVEERLEANVDLTNWTFPN